MTITPEGFFDASSSAAAQNLNVVRGLEVYSIDQVYQALYRPDLVREKLAGDPKGLVREAAARLDLNKVMASGGAPKVSIVTPAGNVANDEVTVEAAIAEQNGGGIGKIEWRVNGVTLGIESRGLERLPEGTASSPVTSRPAVTVKRTLSLEPGENRIEVVAYNGRDLIASDPAEVILKWDGEKSATPPKLHVLAVGVNDYYDSRLKLSFAVPDAKALGEAMKKAGASLYQSVEVTSVLDDGVTIDNLDKVFAEVSRKVHPRDVFVFFLAGHGKTVDGRYHFLPQNFRYEDENSIAKRGIDQDRFQAWFAKIPARKSILLYDTCESGSLTGDRVQQRGIERVAALEKMTRAMGRTVLSASSDDAPALEGYRGHGVFTYALLDGMSGADTNNNGLIEVTELAAFIDQKVPDLSYQAFKMRQIPQMKIVGNSFPVVSRTPVLIAGAPETNASTPIPTKPTHVVVSQLPVDVYAAAARSGAVVQHLPPGTTVTLLEGANGWQLVAKDGQKLGFVEEKALLRLQ
ncbi:caspase family protein [Bradyrhizobium sp. AZCC 2289]|uniref:caspase family protein n=1 Tax=Bradyrhizobium sp. AZCC 2289 TaxID=3117026 RepID=UPI002FEEC42A